MTRDSNNESSTLKNIRQTQRMLPPAGMFSQPPPHEPDLFLIGCIDARLDPAGSIGIPYGKALIKRNIAALVPPHTKDTSGVGAALEFAITKMRVKDVVVMGHTHCGGIAACLDEVQDREIEAYLSPLNKKRDEVKASGGTVTEQARSMEREAVRQSLENLLTYPVVQQAITEGRIALHGWVINTATGHLHELNQATGKFESMAPKTPSGHSKQ